MSTIRKRSSLVWLAPLLLATLGFAGCVDDQEGVERIIEAGAGGEGGGEPAAGGSAGEVGAAGEPTASAGMPSLGGGGEAGAPTEPLEVGWSTSFALPGINGPTTSTVLSVLTTGVRKVWVGGSFTHAGDIFSPNVAVWNGQRWAAVGEGLSEQVRQLAATPDEQVFALTGEGGGGLFVWDGEAWTDLTPELDGSIASIDVSADGTLYVAGSFTEIAGVAATNVAVRSPEGAWSALGEDDGPVDFISSIKLRGEQLCVGGLSDGEQFGVACHDGSEWLSKKANIAFGAVHTLLVDETGALYAGGAFMLEGIDTGGGLARFDEEGETWELVGGGLLGEFGQPDVYGIAVDGERVYATGFFAFAGGAFVRHAAMWNGTRWNDLNGGLQKFMGVDFIEQPRGRALAVDDGGEVYVGGRLTFAGAENALRVARWDGGDWHGVDDPEAVRLGINGSANTVFAASSGDIYVAGGFEHLGGDAIAPSVARFDPAQGRWYSLGAGLDFVHGFAEMSGDIYATGAFVSSGTATLKGMARWDGAAWKSVGGGLEGEGRVVVQGPEGSLYVGGSFTQAGGNDARNVAVWDGEQWSALGEGLGVDFESVNALVFDTEGNLYAGGQFTFDDEPGADNVALWDGASWSALGDGVSAEFGGDVQAMAVYQDQVIIGGGFTLSGTESVEHVAFWDGSEEAWKPLGGGLPAAGFGTTLVQALAVHGDDLYAAGLIEEAGGKSVSHVVRFDGSEWHDVTGGVDDVAEDLAITPRALWVVGGFARAGGFGSTGIARYGLP